MRIPRDVNGQLLADRLRRIFKDVAAQVGCSIDELIDSLDL
ncbi:hypothetical protein [Synechococcus sp. J7-Johnson]|nr:hypothetical protein [Synechococcus sp. J7-Johnson]